jgi:8-oxo-dGTP pyrophosphatase MutT (NUDIX family)
MKTSPYHWGGCVLISYKDKVPYITIVTDTNGLVGLPGGGIESNEPVKVGIIREVREEVRERIFVHQLKKLYEADGLIPHFPNHHCSLYFAVIPHFEYRKIEDTGGNIVEARTYLMSFVLEHIVEFWDNLKFKDKILIKKTRSQIASLFLSLFNLYTTGFLPMIARAMRATIAARRRRWMNLPRLKSPIMPRSHRTKRTTAAVYNIIMRELGALPLTSSQPSSKQLSSCPCLPC